MEPPSCIPKIFKRKSKKEKKKKVSFTVRVAPDEPTENEYLQDISDELEQDTSLKHLNLTEMNSIPLKYPEESMERSQSEKMIKKKSHSKYMVQYQKIYGEEDGAYKNCSVPRGRYFVCNFESFNNRSLSYREGSDVDFHNIVDVLHQMCYGRVNKPYDHCYSGVITKKSFMEYLNKFINLEDHKYLDSCIVVIMSHGSDEKTFITSDNQEIDLNEIYSLFDNNNCPNLAGKPKIFILQFCRVKARMPKTPTPDEEQEFYKKEMEDKIKQSIEGLKEEYRKKVNLLSMHLSEIKRLSGIDESDESNLESRLRIRIGDIPKDARISKFDEYCEKTTTECIDVIQRTPLCKNNSGCDLNDCSHKFSFERKDILQLTTQNNSSSSLEIISKKSICSSNRTSLEFQDNNHKIEIENASLSYNLDAKKIRELPKIDKKCQRISEIYSIFSTSAGDMSFRHVKNGSLLIQALCYVFANFSYQFDIEHLVRKVSSIKFTFYFYPKIIKILYFITVIKLEGVTLKKLKLIHYFIDHLLACLLLRPFFSFFL